MLDRALDALIVQLEKRKFAASSKPRPARHLKPGSRTIPAEVKRQVRERDGDQCTFTNARGHRCPARDFLEFDHVQEVARGGKSTLGNIRLLCSAHNQYAAEGTLGTGFMNHKRQEARRKTATARAGKVRAGAAEVEDERAPADAAAAARAQAEAAAEYARLKANEVIPWLRALKFTAEEARRAAARCESIPDAPLEERVRVACRSFI